jgi:hypothetical protein
MRGTLRSLEREGFLVLLVCVYSSLVLAVGEWVVSTDSWFALTAGRLVAKSGLPTHDTLTVLAHGRRWTDQQWLSQWSIYELDRAGGIGLAVGVHVLLLAAALALSIVVARKRGASPRAVVVVAVIALLPLFLSALQLRTQSFAYLLFMGVLAMVASRETLSWWRIGLLLGILALWANMHGSVVLGVALVSLRGVVDVWTSHRLKRLPAARSIVLALLPWVCLFATPFPREIPRYYAQTIFSSSLSQYLAQWQPSTLSLISLPLFVLAFGFVWLLARPDRYFTRFEALGGLLVVAFALLAVRNWVWLCLFAIALYPKAVDSLMRGPARATNALRSAAGIVGLAIVAVAATFAMANVNSHFTNRYPNAAATAVAKLAATHPSDRVWASVRWGDWLLWREPQLGGRIAYDARAELLTADELKTVALMRLTPSLLPEISRRYRIFLVDRTDEPTVYSALRKHGDISFDDGEVLVASWNRGKP